MAIDKRTPAWPTPCGAAGPMTIHPLPGLSERANSPVIPARMAVHHTHYILYTTIQMKSDNKQMHIRHCITAVLFR